jgi:hypothetical protein
MASIPDPTVRETPHLFVLIHRFQISMDIDIEYLLRILFGLV